MVYTCVDAFQLVSAGFMHAGPRQYITFQVMPTMGPTPNHYVGGMYEHCAMAASLDDVDVNTSFGDT